MTFEQQLQNLIERWREDLELEGTVAAELGAVMADLARTRHRTSERLIRLAEMLQAPKPTADPSLSELEQVLAALRQQHH